MSIANPLVIAYDGSNKSFVRINQDSFGSEYYLREATQDFRMKIRHLVESPRADKTVFERHNCELTYTLFSTDPTVPDLVEQIYFVLRNRKQDPAATVAKLGDMMTAFMTNTHFQDLVSWVN